MNFVLCILESFGIKAGASYVPISGSLKTADGLTLTSIFLPYCFFGIEAENNFYL
jgi:hypothetical protein